MFREAKQSRPPKHTMCLVGSSCENQASKPELKGVGSGFCIGVAVAYRRVRQAPGLLAVAFLASAGLCIYSPGFALCPQ